MAGNRVISAVLTLKDKDFGTTAQKSASAMKDFERKTKHSSNTVKNFGKSATSSFKSVATGAASIVAAIGVTKALSGAFNMVKSSIGSAFDRIDTMESFERTLTTLTGSTEKTKAALEATRDAVTGTGYGLDTAAKSVQDFVTRGMEVDKATKTMEDWGDAVAFYGDGSNEQFASVSDAVGKMYSSGKVGMDQMNRLFDAGIDGVGMYAKATGRDMGTVQKDLSSGKISAEEFLDVVGVAMNEGTNGVQKIAGAAKDAGASWGNTFGNMRAAVTRGVEDIIMKIDDMLVSNGLPDMRSMVSDFGSKFEDVLKGVGDKIPVVTDYLVGMYESAKPGLDWIADTAMPAVKEGIGFATDKAKEMYDFFATNWPLISPVIAGVAATVAAFKTGIVVITAAKATWAAVTSGVQLATLLLNGTLAVSPLGWVALAIGAVIAVGVLLWQNWDTVKDKAGQLWEKTKEVFGGIYDWGHEKIQPVVGFFQGLSDKFNDFKNAISSFTPPAWVSSIGGAISGAASKVGNFIAGSHATGLDRVPYDGYVAELHKGEMVVPATQSAELRKQGVTIDNIGRGFPGDTKPVASKSVGNSVVTNNENMSTTNNNNQTKNEDKRAVTNIETTNVQNTDLPNLIQQLMQLIQLLKSAPKGDVNINVNGTNLTVTEIVNELIPLLKLRMANM